jgi:protein O-mannosyl-transferase
VRWLTPSARLRPGFLAGLILAWTLFTFLPILQNDFVNWDDSRMFLENPYHRGPTLSELGYAWSGHLLGEFMPVTWMSYTLDRSLWGLHAPGYHLTSLILHVLAAVAVFALARTLLRHALGADAPDRAAVDVGAATAALVFAVHPLRVEAVAWVSARGTVLGGLLLVLAVLAYLAGWNRGRANGSVPVAWLAVSMGFFVVSLLARATGLVLPAVLLVLDVYPLRRIGGESGGWWGPLARRAWGEKAAFAVIGALATPMGFLARSENVGDLAAPGWDPLVAVAWATYSGGFYVWKTVGIGTLSPIYPMPTRDAPMLLAVSLSALTTLVITGILLAARRRWPGALAAWLAYLILLAPISGIVPFGRLRGVVDRYTYAACIGWALVAGGAVALGWRAWDGDRSSRFRVGLVAGALLTVLLGWSVISWRQADVWHDGVTLWTRAVVVAPHSPVARSNLGTALSARRDFAAAAVQYREAVRELPTWAGAFQSLGRALAADGRYAEAAAPLRRAVELNPNWVEGHLDLGTVLYNLGEIDQAVAAFTRAAELDPGSVRAHESLGAALRRLGRGAEAARHFEKAAALGAAGRPDLDLAVPRPGASGTDGS